MHPQRTRHILPCKTIKSRPSHLVFLAASTQLFEPRTANSMTRSLQPFQVVRHCMIVEIAAYHSFQPCANFSYWFMSLLYQFIPNRCKRCSQPHLDRYLPMQFMHSLVKNILVVPPVMPSIHTHRRRFVKVVKTFDQ